MIPGLGRSPEEGKGYPLQYSCLENSLNCIAHGVTKSWTRLSNFHFQSQLIRGLNYIFNISLLLPNLIGLPWWLRWRRICLQCGRPRFDHKLIIEVISPYALPAFEGKGFYKGTGHWGHVKVLPTTWAHPSLCGPLRSHAVKGATDPTEKLHIVGAGQCT